MKLFIILLIASINTFSQESDYKSLVTLEKDAYNKNATICCFVDWGTNGWFSKKVIFPNAEVFSIETQKMVSISSLIKDKPIVIQLGSYTCPSYLLNIRGTKALREKYGDKVDFYTLYVRENHPTPKVKAHKNLEDKIKLAKKLSDSRKVGDRFLIDTVDGGLHQKLGNFGNSVYLIGKDQYVNHWSIFANPKRLELGIKELLKAGGVAQNAKFIGGAEIHPIASEEYNFHDVFEMIKQFKEDVGDYNPPAKFEELDKETKELIKSSNPDIEKIYRVLLSDKTLSEAEKKRYKQFLDRYNSSSSFHIVGFFSLFFQKEYQRRNSNWNALNKINNSDKLNANTQFNGKVKKKLVKGVNALRASQPKTP
jgi:hypothetical protein